MAEVYRMTSNVKNTLKRKMFAHFNTRRKRGLNLKKSCYAIQLSCGTQNTKKYNRIKKSFRIQ